MPSQFVLMYHPALGNARASVSLSAVDDHAARGWLLVDGVTPTPSSPYLTPAVADTRYPVLVGGKVPDSKLPNRLADTALKAAFGSGTGRLDLSRPGVLAVQAGTSRVPFPVAAELLGVMASVGVEANLDVVVDVNKNGTTVFADQTKRPRVPAGQAVSPVAVPAVTSVAAGDYLTLDVDAVGGPSNITFVGKSVQADGWLTSVSLARPAGSQAGDVHLVTLKIGRSQGSAATVVTTPSGWGLVGKAYIAASDSDLWMFWLRDTGSGGPWSFPVTTPSGGSSCEGSLVTYRGCKTSGSPIDASAFVGLGWTKDSQSSSLTTTAPGDLLVHVANTSSLATPVGWVTPSGMTARETTGRILVADQVITATGATGTRTSTKGTNDFGNVGAVALLADPNSSLPGQELQVTIRYRETA